MFAALSLTTLGRVELTSGRHDKAEATFDRALKYARLVGLSEVEIPILWGRGALALERQDWTQARGIFEQAIAQAMKIGRQGALMWLHHGVARAQARLLPRDGARRGAEELFRGRGVGGPGEEIPLPVLAAEVP